MNDDGHGNGANDFLIITDSTCDMPQEMVDALGIVILPIRVIVEGKEYAHYPDGRELGFHEFYEKLRAGVGAKTAAANAEEFLALMEPALAAGIDVLYLGFSSALSSTYSIGAMTAAQLAEKYPERRIYAVDTLCASFGQGLLVYLAAQQRLQGKNIDEVRAYVEQIRPQLCHWFTVDDLQHLKRGGRVSAAAAAFGTVLNIKPILHVDDEGRLIPVNKVQGRITSIKALAKRMQETAIDPAGQVVFISHGDCEKEAEKLAEIVRESIGAKEIVINPIGPIVGAHSGPGTIALFFLGTKR
ncbi:MAG: DegV family protein [Clostridium sp.]|nr:DegV family protein [Clostridium sp.]